MIPKNTLRPGTVTKPTPVGDDEERDWNGYRTYLRDLTPEGLWDAYTHVDTDRFPRRRETIEREITRRGLFFVSPYTEAEQRMRLMHLNLVIFALAAAVLHHVPTIYGAVNRVAASLDNGKPLLSPTGRVVSLVSGLTPRETELVNGLALVSGGVALALLAAATLSVPYLTARLRRRALRPDVLSFGLASIVVASALLFLLRL